MDNPVSFQTTFAVTVSFVEQDQLFISKNLYIYFIYSN